MRLKIKTAPTAEPITTAEAKLHLRVDISDDDDYIDALVTAARKYCETYTRRAFITQTWYGYLDEFTSEESFCMPLSPTQSITSIKYNDTDGDEQTLSTDVYGLDAQTSVPDRVYLKKDQEWPSTYDERNAVTIEFVAGFGAASAVPEPITQAIYLLVGHWYENREEVTLAGTPNSIPKGVDALLWSERMIEA